MVYYSGAINTQTNTLCMLRPIGSELAASGEARWRASAAAGVIARAAGGRALAGTARAYPQPGVDFH